MFGKDGPFRPAGMRAQIRSKGKSLEYDSAPAFCLVGRGAVQSGKAVPDNPQKVSSAARVLAAARQPKQAGLFAEKEAGRSGMRKARSWTGLFEWGAVHSDVG